MTHDSLSFIFLNALLINNFVLALFLGICPFLGVSAKRATAWNMGLAVIFVMQNSAMVTIKLFFWSISMNQIIMICGLLLVGFLIGYLVTRK